MNQGSIMAKLELFTHPLIIFVTMSWYAPTVFTLAGFPKLVCAVSCQNSVVPVVAEEPVNNVFGCAQVSVSLLTVKVADGSTRFSSTNSVSNAEHPFLREVICNK